MQDPVPIEELTCRMARNDEAAWREFHRRYFPRLLGYVAMIHQADDDTTAECVQLTFLRVVRHIRTFETESRFWNWLACLAKCATIDYHRGRTRRLKLMERYLHWKEVQRGGSALPPEMTDALERCLAHLSDEERSLLEGKYLEARTYAELAERHSLTEKAVENRLARLRQKLRSSLSKDLCYVA